MASWGSGWLILDAGGANETKIRCEEWQYDDIDSGVTIINYPSRGFYGFTLNTHKATLKIENVFVDNYADWNTLKQRLKTLEDTGTVINIQIQVNLNEDKELFDGTNSTMPVIIKKRRGHRKVYRGNSQFYYIGEITFEQAGALTA